MGDVISRSGSPVDSGSPSYRARREEKPRTTSGFSLGKVFGIEVLLDASLVITGLLVTFNLGMGLLPAWHPEWSWLSIWGVALAAAVLFIASVLLHELSHALVGRKVGVPIRTITLFLFGGMAHMEAEPERPRAEFLTAIVGPLTSLAIGAGATLLALSLGPSPTSPGDVDVTVLQRFGPLPTLLLWLGPINVLLGLFNLIPGFPLDGGRVLRSLLWWISGDFDRATRWSALAGQAVGWLLITCGALMMFGVRIPFFGAGLISGLWSMVLGWFLNSAARRARESLDGARPRPGRLSRRSEGPPPPTGS